jgi:ABC-type branched-subunit amino acid transport system substrate-binding protein
VSLAGDIGEIAFSDLVQLCAQIRCTGSLVLTSAKSGKVLGSFSFENGELFDARMGETEGLEAVYRALELKEATFRVDPNMRTSERRIFVPIGALLLEGMRRVDEIRRATPIAVPEKDDTMKNVAPIGVPQPPTPPTERAVGRWILPIILLVGAVAGGTLVYKLRRAPPEQGRSATAAAVTAPGEHRAGPDLPAGPAGITDGEILFGMAAPFTGPAKELGRQMKIGVEAAFGEVNDAGGVNGRRLRLTTIDDGYEPARTGPAMKELCDRQRVFAIVGNVGTPTAAVALPIALEHKTIFYGAFTGANLLRRDPPDRYVFNFRASYAEETAAVVKYLIRTRRLRPEQIAVFAQQDAFGDAGFEGVVRAIRSLRPDARQPLRVGYKRNTIDVADAVARLREHSAYVKVRAVVMVATYRASAKFIEKMRDLSPNLIFTNVSFVGSTALAEELNLLGPRYANGVIVTQVVPPVEGYSTAILKYKAALTKYAPGEKLDYVSLEGYWAANVLVEALRRTGRQLDTERLVDTLEGLHDLDLGIGTRINYGLAEHQGSHKVWGTQLNAAGHYEVLELE